MPTETRLPPEIDEGARGGRELKACLGELRRGDTLVVWKLVWLGRSLPYLLSIVGELKKRGVAFRSLTEHMDTASPQGGLLFAVFGGTGAVRARPDPRAGDGGAARGRGPRAGAAGGPGRSRTRSSPPSARRSAAA